VKSLLLRRCGYSNRLFKKRVPAGKGCVVPLVAFARKPFDARSACIAVVEGNGHGSVAVGVCRSLGAPVVFAVRSESLEWWEQRSDGPRKRETVPAARIEAFFKEHKSDFDPEKVYRAKTWASVNPAHQLSFVDHGLMPVPAES